MPVLMLTPVVTMLELQAQSCNAPPSQHIGEPDREDATAGTRARAGDAGATSAERYIVRLNAYEPLAAAEARVASALTSVTSWHLPPRSHLAAAHDTDFVVVAVQENAHMALTAALASAPFVRDVHADRAIRRPLAHDNSAGAAAGGQHCGDEGQCEAGAGASRGSGSGPTRHSLFAVGEGESEEIVKRPGRPRTAWSVDEAADESDSHAAATAVQAALLQQRFRAHGRVQAAEAALRGGSAEQEHQDRGAFPARHLEQWGPLLHTPSDGDSDAEHRRRLLATQTQVTTALAAPAIWRQGYSGTGIRVGAHPPGLRSASRSSA